MEQGARSNGGSSSDAPGKRSAPLDQRDYHLAAITGLRAVAATWVVLVHFRYDIEQVIPATQALRPITNAGFLGVDLFFVISGFVLSHRYVAQMGPQLRLPLVADFLVLRLARLFPVHLLMIAVTGVFALAASGLDLGVSPPGVISAKSLIENLGLVHAWFNQPLSWNEPSWTISLEWLAYLCFPLLVLILFRVRGSVRQVPLAVAIFGLAYLPIMLQGLGIVELPDFGTGILGVSLLRILAGFVGGCSVFLLARAWQAAGENSSRFISPMWTWGVTALTLTLVFVLARDLPTDEQGGGLGASGHLLWLVTPLFALLVGVISVTRPRTSLLSRSFMVHGGLASYSLYMTHSLVILAVTSFFYGGVSDSLDVRRTPQIVQIAFVIFTLFTCGVVAWLTWRIVEEPSRRAIRRRVVASGQSLPVEERTSKK